MSFKSIAELLRAWEYTYRAIRYKKGEKVMWKEYKRNEGKEMREVNTKKKNETKVKKDGIEDIIEVKRGENLYVIIDKKRGMILAKLAIDDKANDLINSRLRDSIVKIYYQYGKVLGKY